MVSQFPLVLYSRADWRASTIYLRAADETNSPVESLDFQKFKAFLQKYTHFWVSEWYILKQLFTTVSVKVVDIHPHFVE